jgi:DeoR/GlpR family transcriptional regulator of sugar metabolism
MPGSGRGVHNRGRVRNVTRVDRGFGRTRFFANGFETGAPWRRTDGRVIVSGSDSDIQRVKRRRRLAGAESADPAGQAGSLLAEPRRMGILNWLQEEGSARVRDLSVAFAVSEPTIRQDLEKLEADGYIVRQHGGAYLKSVPQQVQATALHHMVNMEKKRKIGRTAASLIGAGETIILDSGSTTTEIARNLTEVQHLNVITNAINIVLMLGAIPTFSIHMPGGQFKAPTLSVSGEKSAEYFQNIYAEKLFLATAAVSFEAGLTYPGLADIHLKKAMISAARQVYLVADSTKINRVSFSSLGKLNLVHYFITDDGISGEDRRRFEDEGVRVIIAE